ncbi:glycosyltransferase family 2 protein [Fontibacillus sp. BL9]|uniref:glycosyltransferase family 2 protein n=1 Tax=Fontibacillus sp. BL9 TaxID=3389971 RepID=UPI003979C134
MKQPTVSVQIVTYNSAGDIEQCLAAVLRQNYRVNNIVVLDNASSDDTLERIRSFNGKNNASITLLENQDNTGFAPAHNQAIRHTSSDYVLVLNPDVILEADYIRLLVEIMESRPEIGSATGRLVLQDNLEIIDSTGLVMNRIWRAFDRGAGEPVNQWMNSSDVFGVSGAAAMYSRRMIEDISVREEFFDEDFFAYKEDVDVAWRAGLLGWKAYYCAEAVGLHKRGWKKGSRGSQPLFIRKHSFINRYKMIYKNLSGKRWLRHLPQLFAYEIAVHGYILLREPKVLGAWIDFWRELPGLRTKRREVREKLQERR